MARYWFSLYGQYTQVALHDTNILNIKYKQLTVIQILYDTGWCESTKTHLFLPKCDNRFQ